MLVIKYGYMFRLILSHPQANTNIVIINTIVVFIDGQL